MIDKKSEKDKIAFDIDLKKQLHVSPFWGMDHDYRWVFSAPEEKLFINMKNYKGGSRVFDATLNLNRSSFSKISLFKQISRFPFITLVIVLRIHLNAFILWLRRAPFFIHPSKLNHEGKD